MRLGVLSMIAAVLASSCAMPYGGPGMVGPGHMFNTTYGGGMWLLLAIVLAIWCIYLFRNGRLGGDRRETPLDILKRRYAKGEISKEEFDQLRKDIE